MSVACELSLLPRSEIPLFWYRPAVLHLIIPSCHFARWGLVAPLPVVCESPRKKVKSGFPKVHWVIYVRLWLNVQSVDWSYSTALKRHRAKHHPLPSKRNIVSKAAMKPLPMQYNMKPKFCHIMKIRSSTNFIGDLHEGKVKFKKNGREKIR